MDHSDYTWHWLKGYTGRFGGTEKLDATGGGAGDVTATGHSILRQRVALHGRARYSVALKYGAAHTRAATHARAARAVMFARDHTAYNLY